MEKLIHDQIEESNGASEIRNSLFESALFGTGIVKAHSTLTKLLIAGQRMMVAVELTALYQYVYHA